MGLPFGRFLYADLFFLFNLNILVIFISLRWYSAFKKKEKKKSGIYDWKGFFYNRKRILIEFENILNRRKETFTKLLTFKLYDFYNSDSC